MDNNGNGKKQYSYGQRKKLSAVRIEMQVSLYEAEIIKELRKIPNGKVTIHIRDEIPLRFTFEDTRVILEQTDSADTINKVTLNGEAHERT
jgi:hypothetical protein